MMINNELYDKLLRKKGISVPGHSAIPRTGETGPFGLSPAQRGIWFLQQLHPASAAFNNSAALKIEGNLNTDCMRAALRSLLERHELLNVNYRLHQGEPCACPHAADLAFEEVSAEASGGEASSEGLHTQILNIAGSTMDLEHDPLIAFTLLRVGEQEHIWIIRMHHIVADGWSKGILLRDFTRLYEAALNKVTPELQPLAIQYRDYVRWLGSRSEEPAYARDLAFWLDKLEGAPPMLDIPADFKRPSIMSGLGGMEIFELEPDVYECISSFCRKERLSVFHFLLTVFKTLLFRYCAAEDLLVGTPVAGRTRTELEPLIGMFVNTVVVRTQPRDDLPFIDYARKVQEEALLAFDHQELPFDLLVEKLNPDRERSVQPVFQTMFQLDNLEMPVMEAQGLRLSPVPLDIGIAQNDLSVSCWEEDGGLRGTFEFSSDLFTRATVRRMALHFARLVSAALACPQQALGRLEQLDAREEHMILRTWNETARPVPEHGFMSWIERRAVQTPASCAVLEGEQRLSYRDLNRWANRLAALLVAKGLTAETPVIVCLPSSGRFVAAALAVSKAGGAVVPVDPAMPRERIRQMVEELGGHGFALSDAAHAALLPLPEERMILLGEQPPVFSEQDERRPEAALSPQGLAFIIFTSGSTGVPKGVLLERRSIDNLVQSFLSSYQATDGDRLLPITSVASASFIGESLPILAAGGTLVLPETETVLHPGKLRAYMERHQITILSTVPSMIRRLNSDGGTNPGLRLILSGGETLLPNHVDRLRGVEIANGYGLSESGVCSTYMLLKPGADGAQAVSASLGRPVANQQVYVLDAHLQPVPIGVKGQICISGHGLARGYLNRGDLTEAAFVPHPFREGERLLLTGDTGYLLPGGELAFIGRSDRQVQIRGYRIELSEVERHLCACPEVEEAAVHPQPDFEGNLRLIAYYTVRSQTSIIGRQLAHWLEPRIPSYMKPAAYIQLDLIPYNANGKLEVSALPQPGESLASGGSAYEQPQTAMETKIAQVWQEILQLPHFGVEDNFFDLGGHSLLLAKVHDRLSREFPVPLTLVDLFRYPTVRSLAGYLSEGVRDTPGTDIYETAAKQKNAFLRYRKTASSVTVRSTTEREE
ncbi:amino acid adenylation domain-containing protein [Paenibacillus albidus]|uniref:non-ribosomal peptide synthetase n=1 Tax=Paenibacillus albidus TaxID=2041023 RepID=UPI001BEC3EFB|nr:non-ribosomal peptide synthetase [Paenibacillus albidus]MBT2291733.1 amino acid adenylation domain-containing protein [Paenibacillus albidus]